MHKLAGDAHTVADGRFARVKPLEGDHHILPL